MAEPLNATFFAFRKREQSGVLLRTTIAFLLIAAALIAGFIALFWVSIGPVIGWYGEVIGAVAKNDTAAIENVAFPTGLFAVFGGLFLWLFPFYILCAAYEAACLKWMLHGETGGFMGLSLGADTFRVWSVYWLWLLLNMAFSIVMSIIMGVMAGVLAVSSGGDAGAIIGAQVVGTLLQYVLMIYFGVRLAPAAATSIARRKFSFFEAWTVTKDRFWSLLGSFALLYVIYFIISIVLVVVWFTSVIGAAAPDFASITTPQQAEAAVLQVIQAYLQSLTQPQSWIIIGVIQLIGVAAATTLYVSMFGINARAAQAALEEGKIKPAT